MVKQDKITISARALIQRLNRKLAPDKMIKSNRRSERLTHQYGTYYVLDIKQKKVVQSRVDLAQLARRLGAINDWEEINAED